MRGLLRWIFNGAAAVSAVLTAGVCVLWVVSHRAEIEWGRSRRTDLLPGGWHVLTFTAVDGAVRFYNGYLPGPMRGMVESSWRHVGPYHALSIDPGASRAFGFGYAHFHGRWSRADLREVVVPLWALVVGALVLPLWWLRRRQRRRPAAGLCARCGYNLRATPSRCPECGMVPARDAADAADAPGEEDREDRED